MRGLEEVSLISSFRITITCVYKKQGEFALVTESRKPVLSKIPARPRTAGFRVQHHTVPGANGIGETRLLIDVLSHLVTSCHISASSRKLPYFPGSWTFCHRYSSTPQLLDYSFIGHNSFGLFAARRRTWSRMNDRPADDDS